RSLPRRLNNAGDDDETVRVVHPNVMGTNVSFHDSPTIIDAVQLTLIDKCLDWFQHQEVIACTRPILTRVREQIVSAPVLRVATWSGPTGMVAAYAGVIPPRVSATAAAAPSAPRAVGCCKVEGRSFREQSRDESD